MAYSHTKVVGPAGKFGAGFGIKIRRRYAKIISEKKKKKKCPYCRSESVKWIAVGIFHCRKCGAKFTGKAYTL